MTDSQNSSVYDLVIIGSGAAGLAAGIYAGRYLMRVLVVEGKFGGETAVAGTIWNYPGAPGVDGFDLMNGMKKQAKDNHAQFMMGKVTSIVSESGCYTLMIGEKTVYAKTVLFSQGSERRRLGLPNEDILTNKGIHFCVTCDGPLYGGKTVAVVGGGDASVKGVNLLLEYAEKIYLLVRGTEMRAEPINQDEMFKRGAGKVEVLYETQVKAIIGTDKLEKIVLTKSFDGSDELVLDGLFVEIGAEPDIKLAVSIGVTLDEFGYIAVNNKMETNIPGIYAAGDAVNHFGPFKQTVTAAALGAVAATSAYNYYKANGKLCEVHWKPREIAEAQH